MCENIGKPFKRFPLFDFAFGGSWLKPGVNEIKYADRRHSLKAKLFDRPINGFRKGIVEINLSFISTSRPVLGQGQMSVNLTLAGLSRIVDCLDDFVSRIGDLYGLPDESNDRAGFCRLQLDDAVDSLVAGKKSVRDI
jgi:hypothetical protein